MTNLSFDDLLTYTEPILCVMVLVLIFRAKAAKSFLFLVAFLLTHLTSSFISIPVLYFAGRGIPGKLAYLIYFPVYWGAFAIEAVLSLLVIYSIYKLAMQPLKGLQTLGILVFRWVAAISAAVTVGVAIHPHDTGINFFKALVGQLQETSSILTLCLLLFVCFAIRPMGLSYRSRIFGVSFGLGLMATIGLVDAAWLAHSAIMYSAVSIVNGIATCLTLMIWSAYFALPEPKARIIVLPTTSPFLRWNQISLALGDEPGFVAIAGIPPEIFAPAEVEVMRRASAKMGQINAPRLTPSLVATQPNTLSRTA